MTDQVTVGYNISKAEAAKDVARTLLSWKSEGLLDESASYALPRVPLSAPLLHPLKVDRTEPYKVFAFAGHTIALRADPGIDELINPLIQHLEVSPDSHSNRRFDLIRLQTGAALLIDDAEVLRTEDMALLIGAFLQNVIEEAHPKLRWLAMIHGAAVEKDGRGLIFAAPSGSGKSTLAAYLSFHGYSYLADDVVAVSRPEGAIIPWPMPISVKRGSWNVLSEFYPQVHGSLPSRANGKEERLLSPPNSEWPKSQPIAAVLLFPSYVPAAPTELLRISPVEALQQLVSDRIWLGYPIEADTVAEFIAWLRHTPAYTLTFSSLADARLKIQLVNS